MSNEIGTITGIEQGRAKFAYDCVNEVKKESYDKKYKPYVKKIPMLIKTNGLGATFAYINSKNDKAYNRIYNETEKWLLDKDTKKLIPKEYIKDENGRKKELIDILISLPSSTYRAVTIEVLALFNWLKRFVDGLIKD